MATDAETKGPREPSVTVDGKIYAFPRDFTFVEDRLAYAIAAMHAGSLGVAIVHGNPQASLALAVVAMKRAGAPIDMDKLENLPIKAVVVDWGADEETDGQSPPAGSGAEEAAAAA